MLYLLITKTAKVSNRNVPTEMSQNYCFLSGLGKNNSGMKDPLKVNLKFDLNGFGAKNEVTEENNWWTRVFNDAASNLNVNSGAEGSISMNLNDKEGVEITNKSYSINKLKKSGTKLKYGNFLKSSTLDVGKEQEIEGHLSAKDIKFNPLQPIDDYELAKACEGRHLKFYNYLK